jgi:hypothetical protein
MSKPLHESMQARYPGGHLVFDTTTDCPNVSLVSTRSMRMNLAPLNSPLLTDASTAEKMHVRHTLVADNIALIPAQAASMSPSVTVVPSSPNATAVAVRAPAQRDVVITELRDGSVVDTRAMGAGPAPRR